MEYFHEKQRFTQWWILLIPIAFVLFVIYVSYVQLVLQTPVGNNPIGNSELWILWVMVIPLVGLIFYVELTTVIDDAGVNVRLRPFVRRLIKWEDIEEMYLRKYRPLGEFGGYGLRFSTAGTAYNIKGNRGLQLKLKNGKSILIGTSDPERLKMALTRIKEKLVFSGGAGAQ